MGTTQDPTETTAPTSPDTTGASRGRPQRERIYQALREELMSGRIPPWERLGEERLAERFAVSRTPVRDALARLRSDGLVEQRTGGLYPYVPSFEDLADLYELRITLELRGIRRAIDDPSVRHDADRLTGELDGWYRMREHQPPATADFVGVDEQFHTVLLDSSGNPALTAALAGVNQRIRAVRMYDYLTPDRMHATIAEHIEIGELVLRGRLNQALDALHAHVGASKDVVVERAARALAMSRLAHAGGAR